VSCGIGNGAVIGAMGSPPQDLDGLADALAALTRSRADRKDVVKRFIQEEG
jgi:hypothetical protein